MLKYTHIAAYRKRVTNRYTKSKDKLAASALLLSLSGCMGIYEGGFECPPGKGVGCKSISEVNSMINSGALPRTPIQIIARSECTDCESCTSSPGTAQSSLAPPLNENSQIWWAPVQQGSLENSLPDLALSLPPGLRGSPKAFGDNK